MTIMRRILRLDDRSTETPPAIVEARQAITAAQLARRLHEKRRPTGNRYGDALAGYERPLSTEEPDAHAD